MTSWCFFFFFQGSLKEKQSPESLIVRENRWIFLCDMSAWEIWCEENSGPLNKIFKLKPAQFIEMILVCCVQTSQALHKVCAEISALVVEVFHLHLLQRIVSFQNYHLCLFSFLKPLKNPRISIMEFWEKTKEFGSETAWHIFILFLFISHRGNPTSHGLFTKMEKKKIKKINIQNSKIDQANINAWIVKKFFG